MAEPPRPSPRSYDTPVPASSDPIADRLDNIDKGIGDLTRLANLTRIELSELRAFVMVDQAPRITAVEGKTAGQKAMAGVKWVGVAVGVLTIAGQLAASLSPKLVAPIQAIIQAFGG